MQFKFLFSMIFAVFLFMFLFGFMANMFVTYQQYSLVQLYTTLMAFLDIIFLKKDTSAVIEITRGLSFSINFTDSQMKIRVFLKQQNFPLYNKVVFSPVIKSGEIFYSVKTINLPFYVDSVIYLIPIERKSFLKGSLSNYIYFTYSHGFNYKNIKDLVQFLFPTSALDNLPIETTTLTGAFTSEIDADTKRIFILTDDRALAYKELKKVENKIKDSNYWLVFAKPVNEFIYKVTLLNKTITKEKLISLIHAHAIRKGTYKSYYIPKELLLAALLSNSREDFEKKLKKLINQMYYSYLAYSYSKNNPVFVNQCQYYNEIDEIVNELKKLKEGKSKYSYDNISLFLGNEAEKIAKRNREKELSDTPICTLY